MGGRGWGGVQGQIQLLPDRTDRVVLAGVASSKHEGGWENSRKLSKPETQSRFCTTFENSLKPPSVQIRLYKYGKKVLYCFYKIFLKINSTNEGNCVYKLLDPKRFSRYML